MSSNTSFRNTIPELLRQGAQVGRSHYEPMMGESLYGIRNGAYVMNLEKTETNLRRSAQFLHAVSAQKGNVLFVDPNHSSRKLTIAAAQACNQHVLAHSWTGGFLTNGHSVYREVNLYHQLQHHSYTYQGNLPQYRRMKNRCSGLKPWFTKPDVLVLVHSESCRVAIAEAQALDIPVIGIVDAHESPQGITYPVPGNSKSLRFIHHCLNVWTKALQASLES
uniref:Ribosomal protein S2 n=1 Tax=prasinophyte sp. MBIC10622 TaxID=156113 RepID=A0A650AKH6_9CHLO|nr:ribosomal protein S2 [prasinophyte sp. MBIC10622]